MSDTKICLSCNRNKPLTDFPAHRATSDGLSSECRKCKEDRARRHAAADRIYARQQRTGPAPYVLERQEILPSAPRSQYTYTNTRVIPQHPVLALMYIFDQIDEMRK